VNPASWLFLPAAAVLAYFIFAGFKYTRLISNIFLSLVYRPTTETPPSPGGERFTILDSSDKEIEAILVRSAEAKRVALFCHESGSSKDSWEKYAFFLPRAGFHVLAVDFRTEPVEGEANSLSQWPTSEDVERLLTVVRWTKKAFTEQPPIVLFGVSRGADIALAASFRDSAVKAVVADGLFSMKEIFRDYIRKWAPILVRPNWFGDRLPEWLVQLFTELGFWYSQRRSGRLFVDVERYLAKPHVPLLLIHGEKDDYVPASHQRFLEKQSRDQLGVRRFVVPEAGHNQAVTLDRQAYEAKVTEFLETVV